MGIILTLCRNVISAGRSARGRVQPAAAISSGAAAARARAMSSSVEPPLAVRPGVAAAAAEQAAAADAAQEPQQEGQQQGQGQRREKKAKPPPPPRPTHFLALQVSQHPGVTAAIGVVQASLKRHSPHLKKACVEAASAHLTLGVMALNSEAEQARAVDVLAGLAEPLREAKLLAPVTVQLEGLSHFKNQVLYLDVHPDDGLEQLAALAAATRAHFKEAGLLLQADQPFVPHVTIAKTSKLQGWGKKGHGSAGGGKGHGGHGRGHGGGSKHERHDWRADRRDERRAKQQRLEMQAADEEALAGMDWGREEEGGNGGSGGNEGIAQMVANQPAEGGTEEAGIEASASAAAVVLPASATEPPSSSNANNNASTAAAAAAATDEEGGEAGEPENAEPEGGQQAQQAQHGSRKQRQQQSESAGDPPTHHSGSSWRQIDAEAWAQHVAIQGGSVVLGELQLCAMQGRKAEEYYPVLCSLPLVPAEAAAGAAAPAFSEGGAEQAAAAEAVQAPAAGAAAQLLENSEDAGPAIPPAESGGA